MIYGFFDDSGKESNASNPYVVMAGYVGKVEAWTTLSEEWLEILNKHQISGIHMRDLIPMAGEYKVLGWDVQQRDRVMSEAIRILRNAELFGIGIALDTKAWRDLHKRHPQYSKFFGTAQEFCLQRIVSRIVDRLHASNIEDQMTLVWDRDQEFAASRIKFYGDLIRHDRRANAFISAIMFADPIRYPPLQCADILAWETRKELTQKADGHRSTRRWQEIFTLMPEIELDYMGEFYDQAELDKHVPGVIKRLEEQQSAVKK